MKRTSFRGWPTERFFFHAQKSVTRQFWEEAANQHKESQKLTLVEFGIFWNDCGFSWYSLPLGLNCASLLMPFMLPDLLSPISLFSVREQPRWSELLSGKEKTSFYRLTRCTKPIAPARRAGNFGSKQDQDNDIALRLRNFYPQSQSQKT